MDHPAPLVTISLREYQELQDIRSTKTPRRPDEIMISAIERLMSVIADEIDSRGGVSSITLGRHIRAIDERKIREIYDEQIRKEN